MIDLDDLRKNPTLYKAACESKLIKFDMDAFLALDEEYRGAKLKFEQLRAKQNVVSKEMPKLQGEAKVKALEEMKGVSAELKVLDSSVKELEEKHYRLQLLIAAPASPKTPVGKSEADNVEIKRVGEQTKFGFTPLDHIALGEKHGLFDVARGVKIAGTRNYFLKGDGARLQHALFSLALDMLHAKGYLLMDPPHIVTTRAMTNTGYFPGGEEQAFHLDERDKDLHLIGTAEVPVTSYYMDEILKEEELPKRFAGYSPCYRREAGAYGKDTAGLYRVHQFYKVEQVIICKNSVEESAERHAELLTNAEEFVQALELPYRILNLCTADMGQGQVYKNDIECWMPSRKAYGETHSCSTFHEFQARRLALRYKETASGKNRLCHTLNNTLVASPRILIPLIENHQQADGSIRIPPVLRPYMKGAEKIG